MNDCIGNTALILKAQEDKTAGSARTLPSNHTAGNPSMDAVLHGVQISSPDDAHAVEIRTVIGHRVRPDCQPSPSEVCHQALFRIHGSERCGCVSLVSIRSIFKERPYGLA